MSRIRKAAQFAWADPNQVSGGVCPEANAIHGGVGFWSLQRDFQKSQKSHLRIVCEN